MQWVLLQWVMQWSHHCCPLLLRENLLFCFTGEFLESCPFLKIPFTLMQNHICMFWILFELAVAYECSSMKTFMTISIEMMPFHKVIHLVMKRLGIDLDHVHGSQPYIISAWCLLRLSPCRRVNKAHKCETLSTNRVLQIVLWMLLGLAELFVCMSRVYVAAHFPHQVICGVISGGWMILHSYSYYLCPNNDH